MVPTTDDDYRILFDGAPDAIVVVDAEGSITGVNAQAERLFGYQRAELIGRPVDVLLPGSAADAGSSHHPRHSDCSARRTEAASDLIARRKDGSEFAAEISWSATKSQARLLRSAAIRDATERRRAMQEDAWLAAMIRRSSHAVTTEALDGTITTWNAGAEHLYGYTAEEVVGRSIGLLIPPEGQIRDREMLERMAHSGRVDHYDTERVHKDGTVIAVSLSLSPIFDGAGQIVGVARLSRAISEQQWSADTAARHLAAIVESSNDAILTATPAGTVLTWNRGAERIYGYTAEEMIGQPVSLLIPSDARAVVDATFRQVERGERVAYMSTRVRKDRALIHVSVTAAPISDPTGRVVAVAAITRDVTAQKELEAELGQAREDADRARAESEEASSAKTDFLSHMSHELRTPLNAVLGFAQLLEFEEPRPDQQDSISHILKAGRHLLALIDEILDISRIEAGRLSLSLEPVSVAQLIDESVRLMAPLAAARQLVLSPEATDVHLRALADRQRLNQVLLNLLSNACKYNKPGGTITISGSARHERIRIEVQDTGIGIAPQLMSRLFQPFDRLGAPSDIEGTGLGLALSRRLVEAMGGSLSARSQVGRGSTFWLEVPRVDRLDEPLEDSAPRQDGQSTPTLGLSRIKVLYVEDNLLNVSLVERLLSYRPTVDLLVALRGSLALKLAVQHKPELVFLDLHLPDMHGEEVLRRLKAEAVTRDTPVVVVSADATPGQIERLLDAGASRYLTKPYDLGEFLGVIDGLLGIGAS